MSYLSLIKLFIQKTGDEKAEIHQQFIIGKNLHAKIIYIYIYAKNNLGIMAKNGIGIQKNIETSIEYFNEGCACDDNYAYFNLSRIYYFGINVNRNLTKFYKLIEKISNVSFFLGDLFYVNYFGSSANCNIETAKKYLKLILNNKNVFKQIKTILSNMYYMPTLICQRLENFLKAYDLLHSYRTKIYFDFESYILTGTFMNYFEEEEEEEICSNQININEQFYEGFDINI